MKKLLALILSAVLLLSFSACRKNVHPLDTPKENEEQSAQSQQSESATVSGEIVKIYENGGFLMECENLEGYIGKTQIVVNADKDMIKDEALFVGETVVVYFDGAFCETYPLQINNPIAVAAESYEPIGTAPSESERKEPSTVYGELSSLPLDGKNTGGDILKLPPFSSQNIEKIVIADYRSGDNVHPMQKVIRDKKTIEKIARLINETEFKMCPEGTVCKPGTVMSVSIDDSFYIRFDYFLFVGSHYCFNPDNFYDNMLSLYEAAPEGKEAISS